MHENSNTSILNWVYNILYNHSTATKKSNLRELFCYTLHFQMVGLMVFKVSWYSWDPKFEIFYSLPGTLYSPCNNPLCVRRESCTYMMDSQILKDVLSPFERDIYIHIYIYIFNEKIFIDTKIGIQQRELSYTPG